MAFRVRPLAGPSEVEAFLRCRDLAFGHAFDAGEVARFDKVAEHDRMVVATDGGDIVGTGAAYSFEVSMPGGKDTTAAGLKALSTRPTHRRQGVLTAVLATMLADAHTRGDVLSLLWASEAAIYHRFGYGLSGDNVSWELPAGASFVPGPRRSRTPVDLCDNTVPMPDILDRVAPVYEAARRLRPGMLRRSPPWWDRHVQMAGLQDCTWLVLGDPAGDPAGEPGAGPSAYAAYRVDPHWGETGPANRVIVREAVATDPAAERQLWRFLLDLDLSTVVVARHRPADDIVQDLVADVRSMRRSLSDGLWVRILDIPAALTARSYLIDGAVTIEVSDDLFPASRGTWTLTVDAGTPRCGRATGAPPDLSLDIAELSSAVLGGGPGLDRLARAGLVTEHVRGAAARADALLRWPAAPWGVFYF